MTTDDCCVRIGRDRLSEMDSLGWDPSISQERKERHMVALKTSMSTQMVASVTSCENDELQGTLYNSYFDKVISFQDTVELLRKMECVFNGLCFPQNAMTCRRFREQGIRQVKMEGADRKMADHDKPVRATFVIHVKYRQNATWQGTITWADKKITKNFRSAFEMLKLIDNAVEDSEYIIAPEWIDQTEES